MLNKIKKYVIKQQMLQKEDCVIAGVSGGADSICLLFVLLELQKQMGFRLAVVHVNHQLRGDDAELDEQFVEELCKKKQIDFICYRENVELLSKKWKQSTEEAGRTLRKQCFQKAMEEFQGTKIALAHHKNDSAETFLLNLARGTGLKGLGGIWPVQGNIIRPLLCVERSEIETYLQEHGIVYCTDETNASDDYTRNRLRNHVVPYMEQEINEKTVVHMNETMEYLREVYQYLEAQMLVQWEKCVSEKDGGFLLNKERFLTVPSVLKGMILKRMLSLLAGHEKDLESAHLKAMEELLDKQTGRKLDLPYSIEAKRVYEGLLVEVKTQIQASEMGEVFFCEGQELYSVGRYQIFCRVINRGEMEKSLEKGGVKWFDYDIIQNGVSFRSRRMGDYITIHADGRTQKLKSYFINEKIPQEEREQILLVADGSHILWIYGQRCSASCRVTADTKRILEIRIVEAEK